MILFLSGTCFLDGSIHNYISDFLVEKVDGTRLLVEVKPKVFSDNRVNTTKTSSDVSWYDIIGLVFSWYQKQTFTQQGTVD